MDFRRIGELHRWCIAIMQSKNDDYSGDNVTEAGMEGMATRLLDKVHRLKNLVRPDSHTPNHETVRETLRDIHNYSLIGLMLDEGSWDLPYRVRTVYLAGPIDLVDDKEGISWNWRTRAAVMLKGYGITCFNPQTAFLNAAANGGDNALYVNTVNRAALGAADAVLVYMPDNVQMIGTIREIERARRADKAVIVWAENAPKVKRSLETVDVKIVDTLETAVVWVAAGGVLEKIDGLETA